MKLEQQIRLKERQVELAQLALSESIVELRRVLRSRLASRSAMAVGFAGGLFLGLRRRSRRNKTQRASQSKADALQANKRHGLPKHWLGSYFVWPFLLATARDLVLSHRPSRREV
jgi:hypothetical protein